MLLIRVAQEQLNEARRPLPGICYKSKKPEPVQTPFQSQQTGTQTMDQYGNETGDTSFENEMGSYSIADTPEAQAYLNSPLIQGLDYGIDEAADVQRKTIQNQYNNAFMADIPALFRNSQMNADINAANRTYGQLKGAAAQAQAQGNAEEMARRRERLLPQVYQKSGKTKSSSTTAGRSTGNTSGQTSGYNTQIVQPQSGGLLNTIVGGGLGVVGAF